MFILVKQQLWGVAIFFHVFMICWIVFCKDRETAAGQIVAEDAVIRKMALATCGVLSPAKD